MITELSGFPPEILAFECSGRVTRKDYDSVLKPAVEAALKDHKKVRMFYRIARDFDGYEAGAMWEDFAIGMSHLTSWEKIAVVTDIDWIAHSVAAFGFLMPGAVKAFDLDETDEAKAWISA
ncbi:MAG: STAS/SEC14 domain-containing protein [Parvularculaceae bacterium]